MTEKHLRDFDEYWIYLFNGAQVLNMFATSIGVPLVIGLDQYGKYAALFALPASLSVFVQGLYLSNIGKCSYNVLRSDSRRLNFIFTLIGFFIGCFAFGVINGALMTLLFAVMLERFRWEAIVLKCKDSRYISTLRNAEIVGICLTISCLAIGYFFGYKSYLLPVTIVCSNLSIAAIMLMRIGLSHHANSSDSENASILSGGWMGAFVRTYEELFSTQMPYTISLLIGDREAGVFRVTLSLGKLLLKTFPYRQENVIADHGIKVLPMKRILGYFLLVNCFALGMVIATLIFERVYPQIGLARSVDLWILCTSGFQSLLSVFSPLLVLKRPRHYITIIALFAMTVGLLGTFGYFAYQMSFLFSHILLSLIVVRFLFANQAKAAGHATIS